MSYTHQADTNHLNCPYKQLQYINVRKYFKKMPDELRDVRLVKTYQLTTFMQIGETKL